MYYGRQQRVGNEARGEGETVLGNAAVFSCADVFCGYVAHDSGSAVCCTNPSKGGGGEVGPQGGGGGRGERGGAAFPIYQAR